MKVLLINPRINYLAGSGMRPWLPLGILYLSSYLKKNNIETKILDFNFTIFEPEMVQGFDVIGISVLTLQYNNALKLSKLIRVANPNAKIVFGGSHFVVYSEEALDYCDICVISEGEETLLDICNGVAFEKLDGVAYKTLDGAVVHKVKTRYIEDINEIPFPDYAGVSVYDYGDFILGETPCGNMSSICIMTARGCPYNCSFCSSPIMWQRKVRYFSIDYVIANIKHIVDTYGIVNMRIMDETLGANKKRAYEFCDRIEQANLNLNLNCYFKTPEADLDLFRRLVSVGFTWVSLGIESGNQSMLDRINKGTTVENARTAICLAKQAGLSVEGLYMIGNIGETKESLKDTMDLYRELKATNSVMSFATPLPGTRFYAEYAQYGTLLSNDFEKFNGTEPIFIPTGLSKEILEECHRTKDD